jgi:hypothetical protein
MLVIIDYTQMVGTHPCVFQVASLIIVGKWYEKEEGNTIFSHIAITISTVDSSDYFCFYISIDLLMHSHTYKQKLNLYNI